MSQGGNYLNVKVEPVKPLFVVPGSASLDLGLVDGDIDPKFVEELHEIMAHQYGKNKLSAIRVGKNLSLGLNLKESAILQLQTMLKWQGDLTAARAEITKITCVADVASSLQNKYFFLFKAGNSVKYHVWFNVDDDGVDPAPSGSTGIEVAIDIAASASVIAGLMATAIAAVAASFASAVASGAEVLVTTAGTGSTTDASDVSSGFSFEVTQQGCGIVHGWGMSRDFTSVDSQCGKLILHPVANADNDPSRDLTFWKAYPQLDGWKFSGDKERMSNIKFHFYPDLTRAAQIQWFAYGANE